jgi:ATP-dependent Lon protease
MSRPSFRNGSFTVPTYRTFSHTLALKLLDKNKAYVFPGMIETLNVTFPGSLELFKYICADKKFCCLPYSLKNNFYQLPLFSYSAEVKEIVSTRTNRFKLEVKILERIIIDKIESFETQTEELRTQFHMPGGRFTFTVVSGRYLTDDENVVIDPHSITQITAPLCEFMQRHLTHVSNASPNMFNKILHKLSDVNQTTISAQNVDDVRNLSKFSFMIAGTFRGNDEEKRKMFETTNVIERLQLSKNLSQRMLGFHEPLQVFDVDIPTQSLFSFKYSLILILIICIIIYYIRYVIVPE